MKQALNKIYETYSLQIESISSIRSFLNRRLDSNVRLPRNTESGVIRTQINKEGKDHIINFFTQRASDNSPLFNDGEVIAYITWLDAILNYRHGGEEYFTTITIPDLNTLLEPLLQLHKKYRLLSNRQDPRRFSSLDAFKDYVDHAAGRQNVEPETSTEEENEVLVDDNDVKIIHGSSADVCIRYGDHDKYKFCIAHPDVGYNKFLYYRTGADSGGQKATYSTYIIYFKNIPLTDRHHICVLMVGDRDNLLSTFADNHTVTTNWEKILALYPVLEKHKELFKFKELTGHEVLHSFKESPSYETFTKLSYKERITALQSMTKQPIPPRVFEAVLNDKNLLHAIAESGNVLLKIAQFEQLPRRDQRLYLNKTKERYESQVKEVVDFLKAQKQGPFNPEDYDWARDPYSAVQLFPFTRTYRAPAYTNLHGLNRYLTISTPLFMELVQDPTSTIYKKIVNTLKVKIEGEPHHNTKAIKFMTGIPDDLIEFLIYTKSHTILNEIVRVMILAYAEANELTSDKMQLSIHIPVYSEIVRYGLRHSKTFRSVYARNRYLINLRSAAFNISSMRQVTIEEVESNPAFKEDIEKANEDAKFMINTRVNGNYYLPHAEAGYF